MKELHQSLAAFIRGSSSFEALSAAVDRALESSSDPSEVAQALDAARARGLPMNVFAALKGQLAGARGSPDTTMRTIPLARPGPSQTNGEPTEGGMSSTEPSARRGTDDESEVLPPPDTAAPTEFDRADAKTEILAPLSDLPTDFGPGFDRTLPTGETAPARAARGEDFGPGDILRGRFQLITKLGEGGMGAVWKGRDLLKVEARDRYPYVAIKLLQGDFRDHPEAFIALQRETAKQQRLAHPNIATVYDFDRDVDTDTVFMTMEVLEGQGLDTLVSNLPEGGLPVEEATPIIEQLCEGLAYAHSHALVHSDLKPGNCFLTHEGNVKLLDFGIARASKTHGEADGEKTLFDPGELGALTPAYATIEMFEGWDPEPSDDVYALAIMAYQLLTGRHPYRKVTAPKALQMGLKPDPVGQLSKRQNRGLARALAFQRQDRTASVEEFLDELRPKQSHARLAAAAALVWLALLAVLAYPPLIETLEQRENEAIISVLERGGVDNLRAGLERIAALQGDEQRRNVLRDARTKGAVVAYIARSDAESIERGLALIARFDIEWQRDVHNDERAREAILGFHRSAMHDAYAPDEGRYGFAAASREIDALERIYPGSATVLKIRNALEADRQTRLEALGERYEVALAAGRLSPDPDAEDIGDVLSAVAKLDAAHPLLADPRLRERLIALARAAASEGRYADALATLDVIEGYATNDALLAELRFEIESTLERMTNEKLAAEVLARLRAEHAQINDLADMERVREDLLELARVAPGEPLLEDLTWQLETLVSSELERRIEAEQWAQAEAALLTFAGLLELPWLTGQRTRLSQAEKAAGFEPDLDALRGAMQPRTEVVNRLLERPELTRAWEAEFTVPFKELVALSDPHVKSLATVRTSVALLYHDRARRSLETGRHTEALVLLDKARAYDATLGKLAAAEADVQAAMAALDAERERRQRLERLQTRKTRLLELAARGELEAAETELSALAQILPPDDQFASAQAPQAIAEAYRQAAEGRYAAGDLEEAVQLLHRAIELAPDRPELETLLGPYQAALARRALLVEVRRKLTSDERLDVAALVPELAEIQRNFPDERAKLGALRAGLVTALASREPLDGDELRVRLDELRSLFPQAYTPLAESIADDLDGRIREQLKSAPLAGYELLASARAALPGQGALEALHAKLPPLEIVRVKLHLRDGRLTAAAAALQRAHTALPEHSELPRLAAKLAQLTQRAEAAYRDYAVMMGSGAVASAPERERLYAQAKSLWSDNPAFEPVAHVERFDAACWAGLAALGRSEEGVCHDWLENRRPAVAMVVVPSADGAFAIGKYEVTIAHYNHYCAAAGSCRAVEADNAELPVTGVTRVEAQRYARWLSEQASSTTGEAVVYRLPTRGEWLHAASAAGAPPSRGINCRPDGTVTLSAALIKSDRGSLSLGMPIGRALVSTTFGKENAWGLVNPLGNAQEWVTTGAGLAAQGGAFTDDAGECVVTMSRAHTGEADEITGFRLVRELH